jgi:hypothetical protein
MLNKVQVVNDYFVHQSGNEHADTDHVAEVVTRVAFDLGVSLFIFADNCVPSKVRPSRFGPALSGWRRLPRYQG